MLAEKRKMAKETKINISDDEGLFVSGDVREDYTYKMSEPTVTFSTENGDVMQAASGYAMSDSEFNYTITGQNELSESNSYQTSFDFEPKITMNGETFSAPKPGDDGLFIEPVASKFNEDVQPEFAWRYGEGSVLADLTAHMKSTYTSHYTEDDSQVQTLDVFAHRGSLGSTSIDNAIKYLMRYGKKEGKNEKDLIKAMHYLVVATAYERKVKKT